MKPLSVIVLIIGIFIVFISLSFWMDYSIRGFIPAQKWLTSKEVKDSTGCYLRIDKHFTVRYEKNVYKGIESPEFDRWILYFDGIKTSTYCYVENQKDRYDLIQCLLDFYYDKPEQKEVDPIYKLRNKCD